MKFSKTYLYLLFLLALVPVACKKSFLDTNPTDRVSETTAFSSIENVRKTLNGTYRILYTQFTNQHRDGHGAMMINLDAMGEDYVRTNSSYVYHYQSYRWSAHRSASDTNVNGFAYSFYYIVISNANMIIENVDHAEGTENEKRGIKGEALALRAWAHFQLVQLYGKRYDAATIPNNQPGIPVVINTETAGQPRATVEAVYAQINADLDQAIDLLTDAPARTNKTHVNINVAKGFKARVALTMQNWAVAAQYAKEARTGFTLMTNAEYLGGFTDISNKEWMWGIIQPADQVPTFGSFYAYMSSNFNSSFTRLNPKLINSNLYAMIAAGDVRKKLWWNGTAADRVNFPGTINPNTMAVASGQIATKPAYMHRKFMVSNVATSAGDIPYMRAGEMYLIEAEAEAQLGQATAKETLYALARNRNPSYTMSTNAGQSLVDEILIQRRIELWGEGFRFFDLKRTNAALDRREANHKPDVALTLHVPAGDHGWQWLIPQSEINSNPAIGQANQNP